MSPFISRRQLMKSGGSTLAAAVLPGCSKVGLGAAQTIVATSFPRNLMMAPRRIPASYLGMHFHRWPQGLPLSSAPTYPFGTVRSHDYKIAWNEIHTAPSVFDWSMLDVWADTHFARGRKMIYTLYGTPTWCASMKDVRDAYGKTGAGGPPRDLSVLEDFVAQLLSRYKGKGTPISAIEIWNEPHFNEDGMGFWWGSPERLAEMGRVVYRTAKKIDPQILVLSPGFDGLPEAPYTAGLRGIAASMELYLRASDGDGGTGARNCNAIAIHTYNAYIRSPTSGIEGTWLQVRGTLKQLGISLPVFITETGYSPDSEFGHYTVTERASAIRRQAAFQAALGAQAICFYSHDDSYSGNPASNPEVSNALAEIHNRLSGRTLDQVIVVNPHQLRIETDYGSFTW